MAKPKRVLHVIYQYSIGGLEKVMSECINHLDDGYEHRVVSLTTMSAYAAENLNRNICIDVMNKRPGNDWSLFIRLYRLIRSFKPDVLHTYNLPTLEYQLVGFLARVKTRVHAEHGRDFSDPKGENKKYNLLRRLLNPFIHQWIPVSADLHQWLRKIGLPQRKMQLIYNGVDTQQFHPIQVGEVVPPIAGFPTKDHFVIGTIGRLDPVKNQASLIRILSHIHTLKPELKGKLAVVIVGDGSVATKLAKAIQAAGLQDMIWMPGTRYNIPEIMRYLDLFVLPSIAEGVPMTLLEAMASGLPVICSQVGGIPEVIVEGCGIMLAPTDEQAWAEAIIALVADQTKARVLGEKARQHVETQYSIQSMVKQYRQLYEA